MLVKAKRKAATARVAVRRGTGIVRLNGSLASLMEPALARELMLEPLSVSEAASALAKKVDISINVSGGGLMGQMRAARTGIAKALVAYSGSAEMRAGYGREDLVDDARRVETKKYKGPKARARFQKSYR